MFSAKEAAGYAIRASSPRKAVEIADLLARAPLVEDNEVPDFIVGGTWPTKTRGALRTKCSECGIFLALGPNSGQPAVKKWPDTPVVCLECAKRLVLEADE